VRVRDSAVLRERSEVNPPRKRVREGEWTLRVASSSGGRTT
jgi:hypothetical protein